MQLTYVFSGIPGNVANPGPILAGILGYLDESVISTRIDEVLFHR